jgi:septum formation protein
MIDVLVPVVLASSSRARRELLHRLISDFRCVPSLVEEALIPDEEPPAAAVRLARAKAREVAARQPESLVIGADTLVVCRGQVMGKPKDGDDAIRMLTLLTTTEHSVVTGVAVVTPDARELAACVPTSVRMTPMSAGEIRRYCAQPEVLGWAGAYALQEDDPNVQSLSGSKTGVMGLPLEELGRMLRELYPCAGDHCGIA